MKKLLFILAFLFPLNAHAVLVVYSNASCTFNGNGTAGTCAASGGAAGAYNSLSNAIAGVGNLTQQTTIHMTGSTVDSTCFFATNTTSAANYLLIDTVGAERPSGVWDATKPRLACSDASAAIALRAGPNFVRLDGLQIENTDSTNGDAARGVFLTTFITGSTDIRITNSIIRYQGGGTNTSGSNKCIDNNGGEGGAAATQKLFIANTICYGFNNGLFISTNGVVSGSGGSSLIELDNNTIVDTTTNSVIDFATYGNNDTVILNNNILKTGGTGAIFQESGITTYTHAANLTSDATSPDGASFQSISPTFQGAGDYRLSSSDLTTAARDHGVTVTGTIQTYSTDIAGTSRPIGSAWDIGAFEAAAGAAGTLLRTNVSGGIDTPDTTGGANG